MSDSDDETGSKVGGILLTLIGLLLIISSGLLKYHKQKPWLWVLVGVLGLVLTALGITLILDGFKVIDINDRKKQIDEQNEDTKE